jgi:hypothetical protein
MLLSVCHGDHPSEPRRIGRDTSMSRAHTPSARRRTITTLRTMLVGDYAGSALAVPLCGATWPIEEMPCEDVAGFCLAAPRMSYVSAAFWSASLRN